MKWYTVTVFHSERADELARDAIKAMRRAK
jgi:hypothetical protein